MDMVGTPAKKVFIADGSRYSEIGTEGEPDYNGDPFGGWGGAFCDVGPYSLFSRSWTPEAAGGLFNSDVYVDPRSFSYRHGAKDSFRPLGNYKMNVGFFDTHVETMTDLTSADPHMWMPKGFRILKDNLEGDVAQFVTDKYFPEDAPTLTDGRGREYYPIQ